MMKTMRNFCCSAAKSRVSVGSFFDEATDTDSEHNPEATDTGSEEHNACGTPSVCPRTDFREFSLHTLNTPTPPSYQIALATFAIVSRWCDDALRSVSSMTCPLQASPAEPPTSSQSGWNRSPQAQPYNWPDRSMQRNSRPPVGVAPSPAAHGSGAPTPAARAEPSSHSHRPTPSPAPPGSQNPPTQTRDSETFLAAISPMMAPTLFITIFRHFVKIAKIINISTVHNFGVINQRLIRRRIARNAAARSPALRGIASAIPEAAQARRAPKASCSPRSSCGWT